jgi:hypothetical protein
MEELMRNSNLFVHWGANHSVHTRGFALTMILALMFMFSSFAFAQRDPFGKPDTCRIITFQDEKKNPPQDTEVVVMASVSVFNDEELVGMTLPFSFGNGKTPIRCDSVKFNKTRVEYFQMKTQFVDTVKQTVLLGLLPDLAGQEPPLGKGDGEVARIYFTLKKGAKFQDFFLDTTLIRPSNRLKFVTPAVKSIYPAFDNKKAMIRGGIPIKIEAEEKAKTEEKKEGKEAKEKKEAKKDSS